MRGIIAFPDLQMADVFSSIVYAAIFTVYTICDHSFLTDTHRNVGFRNHYFIMTAIKIIISMPDQTIFLSH